MIDRQAITEQDIWDALREVPDPEIPPVSVVDLGVIPGFELDAAAGTVRVRLMPTFSGCPAIEFMRDMIRERLEQFGLEARVDLERTQRWTSDLISEAGRRGLERAGVAPPGPAGSSTIIPLIEPAQCPHCGSRRTTLESAFGPTLCRAIAHCRDCRQSFEQFKPL
jgi:ring-1,2-phenylacetyl-CoA epoxidase subunit PaaD